MTKKIRDALNSLTPNAEWGMSGDDYETLQWFSPNIPQPNKEAVEAEVVRLNEAVPLNACKDKAKKLLADTDWALIPDAAASLVNQADFIAYRIAVRALAINPVVNPSFPAVPTAQWSN